MPRVWRFAPFDASLSRSLCAELEIPALMAQVLVARGIDTRQKASTFLAPKLTDLHDPSLLPGIDDAVGLVTSAIAERRHIRIYGDYDVDGVTGTSILLQCLRLLGADCDFYIPDRFEEGYGLNADAIRQLAKDHPHHLMITVDCGIGSVHEAEVARDLGVDLIITDHHTPGDQLPAARVLVHPGLPGSEYPFRDLCGAGVAFKLAWAVCRKMGDGKRATPAMREYLLQATALAAIGTIGDVVPLWDENRSLVRFGLQSLSRRASLGLAEMLKLMGKDEQDRIDSGDIGFQLGPRINAAGRLKQARLGVELLTTTSETRAGLLAKHLDELNKQRKKIERRIFKEAREMVEEQPALNENGAIVLAREGWHKGVIGIVASRVAEHFEKPAVVISLDPAQNGTPALGVGSCRSWAGCNLHAALCDCREKLVAFGGHEYAAGLRLHAEDIETFRNDFGTRIAQAMRDHGHQAFHEIDAEVRLPDVTLKAVDALERLGPFGRENQPPLFAASGVEFAGTPGRMGDGQHFNARFRQHGVTLRGVAFGKGDWAEEIPKTAGPFSICFKPKINVYRGRRNVELEIIDWRPDV